MKKIFNKILAGIASAAIVFGLVSPITTYAADPKTTIETINENETGSITLIKLSTPTSEFLEAHGLESDTTPIKSVPIQGVQFKALKIADISTYLFNGEIGTYYTNINSNFASLLSTNNIAMAFDKQDTENNKKYYKATTIEAALKTLNNRQLNVETLVNTYGTAFTNTNGLGKTTLSNLPLGLYLIAETDVSNAAVNNSWLTGDDTYLKLLNLQSQNTDPSQVLADGPDGDIYNNTDATKVTISSKTVPYLVSVPTTNTAKIGNHEPGTVWQYDIVSYPKNRVTSITKMIIDQDDNKTLRTYEDYEIGDTIHQVIFADVSALEPGKKHEKFIMSDTMSESLTYSKVVSVKYGTRTVNPTTTDDFSNYTALVANVDYTITVPTATSNKFSITFTQTGLAKLDAINDNYLVVVSFDVILNNKAKIGTERQNMNQPDLVWQNTHEEECKIVGNKIYVFTYGLDITKEGLDDPTKATFRFNRINENGQPDGVDIQVVKESEGIYHLYDNSLDDPTKIVTRLNPNSQGKVYVKGVDSEEYCCVEVATESGKNLLKGSFDFVLTAPNKGRSTLANPVDPANDTHRDGTVTAVATTIDHTIKTDAMSVDLQTENGIVYITLINNDVVSLTTGGSGTYIYYIIAGAVVLVGVGAAIFVKKRKKDDSSEE